MSKLFAGEAVIDSSYYALYNILEWERLDGFLIIKLKSGEISSFNLNYVKSYWFGPC